MHICKLAKMTRPKPWSLIFGRLPREDVTEDLRSNYFDSRPAYFPAMYALERHRWKEAVALRPPRPSPTTKPSPTGHELWEQDTCAISPAARDTFDEYDAMVEATKKGKHAFKAKYTPTDQNEAHAWLAFAEGKSGDALGLLRRVADKQDVEGKGEVELPVREMLGDMLLEMGRPREALSEYEKAMKGDPNRFNGLRGAGRAANNCDNRLNSRPELSKAASLSPRN